MPINPSPPPKKADQAKQAVMTYRPLLIVLAAILAGACAAVGLYLPAVGLAAAAGFLAR